MGDTEVLIEQVMQIARDTINEDVVRNVQCVIQFKVDMGGGNVQPYFLNLKHGGGSVDRGEWSSGPVAATIHAHAEDIHRLLTDESYYLEAFFTGRIKLDISGEDQDALGRLTPFVKDYRALFKATLDSM